MKSFDAFGRPVQEFQVKTNCGGYLSVCSLCMVMFLFVTELRYFLQLETKDEMLIDQNQDQKYLNVSINVTLPMAPCAVLGINLLDPKKANIMHVVHEIYKTRISPTGKVLGRKVRDSLMNVALNSAEVVGAGENSVGVWTTHATTHLRCPSCFQSHIDEDDCCFSCEEVKLEFQKRGWSEKPVDYVFGQCVADAYKEDKPREGEGCRVEALLHVRKVPATVHIGVARYFKPDLLRVPGPTDFLASLDFSHTVHSLSFGPDFPGLVHVLDGRQKQIHTEATSEHYQYDIHVIPTRYTEDGFGEVLSHQYSVTEYAKAVDVRDKHEDSAAHGLWLSYDFTPFEVKVTKSRKSILHFLTECCAIIGGVLAFTGMLDNFAYQIDKSAASIGGSSRVELTALRE